MTSGIHLIIYPKDAEDGKVASDSWLIFGLLPSELEHSSSKIRNYAMAKPKKNIV